MDIRVLKAVGMLAALLLTLTPASVGPQEEEGKFWPPEAPSGEASLEGLPLLVLDPGHGGADPGALGPGGLTEAEVVWTVASALKLVLERERVARVRLTRSSDSNPSLPERTAVANGQGAALFVSLHMGAAFHSGAKGILAYLASTRGRSGNVGLNGKPMENFRPTRRRAPKLPQAAPVRWGTVQSPYRKTSRKACEALLSALTDEGLFESGGLHEADTPILHGAAMPACLVELATITHPAEEAALRQEATRQALINALSRGVPVALEGGR
jgi:N-acetylmuramoyl-L-alanine amidase